jgi:WD40 repeat protein
MAVPLYEHRTTARVWDLETGSLLRTFSPNTGISISGAAFSPDSKLVFIAGGDDPTAALFDVHTGKKLQFFYHVQDYYSNDAFPEVFSPDGKYIVTTDYFSAILWNPRTGEDVKTFQTQGLQHVSFSQDSKQILIADRNSRSVTIWDVRRGTKVHEFNSDLGDFLPNPKYMLIDEAEGDVDLLDTKTYEVIRSIKVDDPWLDISVDSKYLLTLADNGTLQVWNIETGTLVKSLVPGPNPTAQFLADTGKVIGLDDLRSTGPQTSIHVWDIATGAELLKFQIEHPDAFSISPDGQNLLISTKSDGPLQLWNLNTGQQVKTLCWSS